MQKNIDRGFCLSFARLSHRRKFIRTLWLTALACAVAMLIPAALYGGQNKLYFVGVLMTVGVVQGAWYYRQWKRAMHVA